MNYQLTQKAWKINFDKIEEGFLYSERVCYAENRNKAKSELLSKSRKDYDTLILKYTDEDVTYLTIPVVRYKAVDKYLFEGKELTSYQIDEIINERQRIAALDVILNDAEIQFCYIRKGYYYRPNRAGYTEHKIFAGVYPKDEAIQHAKSVREIELIPIDIHEHNAMIQKEIDDLKTRFIEL